MHKTNLVNFIILTEEIDKDKTSMNFATSAHENNIKIWNLKFKVCIFIFKFKFFY